MTVLTGSDGDLIYGTARVGKVRDWTLNINRDALEDTCVGEYNRTFITGLRNTTGSCTIYYDPSNNTAVKLLNTIFDDAATPQDVSFVFNRSETGSRFRCNILFTGITESVDTGAAQAVSCTFQVSGEIDGRF